jgi:CheY-like chemotaxis protein
MLKSRAIDCNGRFWPARKWESGLSGRALSATSLEVVHGECKPPEVAERGERDITAQIRTRVLIIEDEPLIALDLQNMVEQMGHVTNITRTHAEAVRVALKRRPGLILADIKLADGSSGLEAVKEILRALDVPVVFITAFPERCLTKQAPDPAFLIAKPFSADSVKAVVSQALLFGRKSKTAPRLDKNNPFYLDIMSYN